MGHDIVQKEIYAAGLRSLLPRDLRKKNGYSHWHTSHCAMALPVDAPVRIGFESVALHVVET